MNLTTKNNLFYVSIYAAGKDLLTNRAQIRAVSHSSSQNNYTFFKTPSDTQLHIPSTLPKLAPSYNPL